MRREQGAENGKANDRHENHETDPGTRREGSKKALLHRCVLSLGTNSTTRRSAAMLSPI